MLSVPARVSWREGPPRYGHRVQVPAGAAQRGERDVRAIRRPRRRRDRRLERGERARAVAVDVDDPQLGALRRLRDVRDLRLRHARLAGELEDDVVGEAVHQAAQLRGRAAVLALGDQAARGEVRQAAAESHRRALDRQRGADHRGHALRRGARRVPGPGDGEDRRVLQVVGQDRVGFDRLRARHGAVAGRHEALDQDADLAIRAGLEVDAHFVLRLRRPSRPEGEHDDERERQAGTRDPSTRSQSALPPSRWRKPRAVAPEDRTR